ncbi:MAG: hypothetical protein KAU20_04545 [Nanoarchaeota archaeon]|nr:hypothetical protein [Nanoarchaeota archaeon]
MNIVLLKQEISVVVRKRQYNKMNKKSQISIEFLFSLGIVLFILIILSVFSINKNRELNYKKDIIEKKQECLKFSNFILYTHNSGSGTSIQAKTQYSLKIYNTSTIEVHSIDNDYFVGCTIPIKTGNYNLTGDIKIENINGTVIIS